MTRTRKPRWNFGLGLAIVLLATTIADANQFALPGTVPAAPVYHPQAAPAAPVYHPQVAPAAPVYHPQAAPAAPVYHPQAAPAAPVYPQATPIYPQAAPVYPQATPIYPQATPAAPIYSQAIPTPIQIQPYTPTLPLPLCEQVVPGGTVILPPFQGGGGSIGGGSIGGGGSQTNPAELARLNAEIAKQKAEIERLTKASPTSVKPNVISGKHTLTISDVAAGAKKLQAWYWLPMDTPSQKLTKLDVQPIKNGKTAIIGDGKGNKYLYVEVENPEPKVVVTYDFAVERSKVESKLYTASGIEYPANYKELFAEYLDLGPASGFKPGAKPELEQAFTRIVGTEKDKIKIMRKIYDEVASYTHYNSAANTTKKTDEPGLIGSTVSDDDKPKSGKNVDTKTGDLVAHLRNRYMDTPDAGNPEVCIIKKGGGCTDLHMLAVYLARKAGIPARIQFGSRVNKKRDQPYTPGYRCNVEYWTPGHGWVPMDCAQAGNSQLEDDGKLKSAEERLKVLELYFSGMDDGRVAFAEGRNISLNNAEGKFVEVAHLLIGAWVKVDDNKHYEFERQFSLDK